MLGRTVLKLSKDGQALAKKVDVEVFTLSVFHAGSYDEPSKNMVVLNLTDSYVESR